MNYIQTEEAFVEQIKTFENLEMVNRFLDLAKEMVEYCGLGEDDERIACTIRKEKGILPISIGRRWVFQMNFKPKYEDAYQIAFLFSEQIATKYTQNFSTFLPYNKQEIPPVLAFFDFEKFKMTDEFNHIWLETTLEETKKITKSNLRNNHNPYFYQAIVDLDYRKKVLDPNYIPENQLIEEEPETKNSKPMKFPLNLILYGPPGTGKTYSVKEKAVRIIEPDYQGDINEKFKELKEAGQIEFVTFHQAFAYEEFIEGLSATTENGRISYAVKDGIFKRMANRALYEYYKQIYVLDDEYKIKINEFRNVYMKFLHYLRDNPNTIFYSKDGLEFFLSSISSEYNIYLNSKQNSQGYIISKDSLESLYLNFTNYVNLSNVSTKNISDIINPKETAYKNASRYWAVLSKLLDFKKGLNDEEKSKVLSEYDSLDYKTQKDLLKFLKPKEIEGIISDKNYVLIIDEINRANISKVFGELITLLEPSKRLGADDEHTVRLPYSQDTFGVPQNLYLIGTMNTADRSIALLDIALRRRFEFEEMMPNSQLLNGYMVEGVELDKLLQKINQRIEFLLDRDHTIGHAYFLNIKSLEELAKVFLHKIIPLLQEYFYDNWEKISLVLKNKDVQFNLLDTSQKLNTQNLFGQSVNYQDDKPIYKIKSLTEIKENPAYFTGIYLKN